MHILAIEDNRDVVANLSDFFEAQGHSVTACYDGPGGLETAASGRFDAVILDLMLPGMDGLDLCAALRERGSETPVLMLTARDTLQDKLDGFGRGADDYLVKPFSLRELEARVSALVRRSKGDRQQTLKVGDLVFEPQSMEVRRNGIAIELPPIPLKILALLMRNSRRVVRRGEIEREIWGDSPPDSDALRAHLHILRSAIDKPFDTPLLRTIHGIGYRLASPE